MSGTLNAPGLSETSPRMFLGLRSRTRDASRALPFLFRCERGGSAIEFALLAPLLIGAVLVLGLLGIQINHRIKMDQIVRAGALLAVTDPGSAAIEQRMREVALAKGYENINTQGGSVPGVLHLQSPRSCFCLTTLNSVICGTECPDQRPAIVRYTPEAAYVEPLTFHLMIAMSRIIRGAGLGIAEPWLRLEVVIR